MSKKVRVMEVNINDIGQGGAWSFIKNAMEAPSMAATEFNFFTLEPFESEANINYVENKGGKVYVRYTCNRYQRQFKTYFDLKKLLHEEKMDIVHIHSDVAFKMFAEGIAAKAAGVPHIVFHSHCTGVDRGHRQIKRIMHEICKPFLGTIGTELFACSYKAGNWMYTKSSINKKGLKVINNAVDCRAFSYDEKQRKEKREKLRFSENDIVIGHVGRFMYQKNHEFLIAVFEKIYQRIGNAKLILIGEGELEYQINNLVKIKALEKAVSFIGVTRDVSGYLQAMDLLLLPSRFEGLPVVGIEAQAAGLPCLMADTITKETNLFGLVEFESLSALPEKWAEKTMEMIYKTKRQDTYEQMVESGYDISINSKSLKDIYWTLAGDK